MKILLKNINENFRYFLPKFEFTIFVTIILKAYNHYSNMPFLRNEFSEKFEEIFTITIFPEMTDIYDQTKQRKIKA